MGKCLRLKSGRRWLRPILRRITTFLLVRKLNYRGIFEGGLLGDWRVFVVFLWYFWEFFEGFCAFCVIFSPFCDIFDLFCDIFLFLPSFHAFSFPLRSFSLRLFTPDSALDSSFNIRREWVNRRGIYKDTVGSSSGWTDYQLRPNALVAMAVVRLCW